MSRGENEHCQGLVPARLADSIPNHHHAATNAASYRTDQRRLMHEQRESKRLVRCATRKGKGMSSRNPRIGSMAFSNLPLSTTGSFGRKLSFGLNAGVWSDTVESVDTTTSNRSAPFRLSSTMEAMLAREESQSSDIIEVFEQKGEFDAIKPWLCSSSRITLPTKNALPLAKGAFGEVYKVFLDSTPCAAKKLKKVTMQVWGWGGGGGGLSAREKERKKER